MSFFVGGAPVAACPRAGASETDIFTIGSTGQLAVSWVTGAGAWNQPLPLTPINTFPVGGYVAASQQFGAASPQTDVFAIDAQGALNVLYAGKPGSSFRQLKLTPPNTYSPGSSIAVAGLRSQGLKPGPLNQTNVFVMAADGGLNVHFVVESGAWNSMPIGPRNVAALGTPLAAGTRSGGQGLLSYETFVFFVDVTGALNAYSIGQNGMWQREVISAPGIFEQASSIAVSQQVGTGNANSGNQLDVFAVDAQGTLNVFYTSGAGWSSQKIRPDIVLNPGIPVAASQQFITGVNQTDVMLFDPSGALNIFYVDGAGAWNRTTLAVENIVSFLCPIACSRQIGSPNNDSRQLDVFFVDALNQLNIYWVVEGFAWEHALLADQATLPLKGIGSNANIELHNNCSDITGLQVEILITEDIIADQGIAFQLNCASALNYAITWQQYLFTCPPGSQPPVIKWGVNNWAGRTVPIDDGTILWTFPAKSNILIPAGYRFVIQLLPYQDRSAIGGAVYRIFDPTGKELGQVGLELVKEISHITNKKITIGEMAPIIGFQLDIVGWMNGAATTLTSGAGVITYSIPANETVTPLNQTISCLNSSTIAITAETSNVSCQTMAAAPTGSFQQAFQAIATN